MDNNDGNKYKRRKMEGDKKEEKMLSGEIQKKGQKR